MALRKKDDGQRCFSLELQQLQSPNTSLTCCVALTKPAPLGAQGRLWAAEEKEQDVTEVFSIKLSPCRLSQSTGERKARRIGLWYG